MTTLPLSHKTTTIQESQTLSALGTSQQIPFRREHTAFPQYRAVLNNRLLLDQYTGHLYRNGAGADVTFPLLMVRHGETNGNINGAFQGQIDIPDSQLNATGKVQVKHAAKRLYRELLDLFGDALPSFAASGNLIVIQSPLGRTRETAKAFLDEFEAQTDIALSVITEKKLAESCFGVIEGLTLNEVEDEELRKLAEYFRAEQDATVDWKGTGESYLDVIIRADTLLAKLNQQYAQRPVLVIAFSHGAFINALRVAVADEALIEEDGMIAFRRNGLKNTESYWVGDSRRRIQQIAARWRITHQE
ncbi:MAG: histidine phosphatase family protein [Candidatus Vecturithrix sp.]|jgi:broad specificity phosphatase PhoE|nr:histidine phosphatase family protein [Candidatus Vecturithrix sp.]